MAAVGSLAAGEAKEEEPSLQTVICKSAALGDLEAVKKALEQSPTDLVNGLDKEV
jgi:hypothetical protein